MSNTEAVMFLIKGILVLAVVLFIAFNPCLLLILVFILPFILFIKF